MFDPVKGGGRGVAALLTPAGADRLQLQASRTRWRARIRPTR
jgi:hypothetical protein